MKYTQEFCEREYNLRALLPEYPVIFSRWAAQSAATRRLHACLLDLAYGSAEHDEAAALSDAVDSESLLLEPVLNLDGVFRGGAELLAVLRGSKPLMIQSR